MRVLVTGARGCVGRAIVTHLAASGFEITGLDLRPGQSPTRMQLIQANISSEDFTDQLKVQLPPCDAIVHAASCLGKNLYSASISLTNCLGTQQVLKLSSMWNAKNFIYFSGVHVIGIPKQLPITEEHPTFPLTAYHASKLYGEHLVRLAGNDSLITTSLRLTAPVGPGMSSQRILSVFIKRALANEPIKIAGRGTRQQNYVDVRDVAIAVKKCLLENVSGLFNIGSDKCISNLDLAQRCVRCLGSASSIDFSGEPDPEEGIVWDVSIAKAANQFGYRPLFTIEDSIKMLASEYENSDNQ